MRKYKISIINHEHLFVIIEAETACRAMSKEHHLGLLYNAHKTALEKAKLILYGHKRNCITQTEEVV